VTRKKFDPPVTDEIYTALETHFALHGLSVGKFTLLMQLFVASEQGLTPSEFAERAGVSRAAIASVITATFLCWLTNYGFFKFYWVIAKWVLTTALIIFGTFRLYPWSEAATSISNTVREKAFTNPLYVFDTQGVLIGGVIQLLSLLIIIGISVIKPWGKRKIEDREQNKPIASSL